MKALCIIPCGRKKIWDENPNAGPTLAKDVYIGVFAKKCLEYAITFYPDSYCILSAKYGFLWPDDIVPGPYEVTFKKPSTKPISIKDLREIASQKNLIIFDELIIIAGKDYVRIVEEIFNGKIIKKPFDTCKGNGEMMGKLKKAILSGTPL